MIVEPVSGIPFSKKAFIYPWDKMSRDQSFPYHGSDDSARRNARYHSDSRTPKEFRAGIHEGQTTIWRTK